MTNKGDSDDARRLHAYLTRKAQARLDTSAVVYARSDGRWILERTGQADHDLGENFGRAKESLQLLIAAHPSDRPLIPAHPGVAATAKEFRQFLEGIKAAGPDAAQERVRHALESISTSLADAPYTAATASTAFVIRMIDPDVWAARANLAQSLFDDILPYVERLDALNSSGGLSTAEERERQELEAAVGLTASVLIEAAEGATSLADRLEELAAMLPDANKLNATLEIQEKTAEVMRLLFRLPPVQSHVLSLLKRMGGT